MAPDITQGFDLAGLLKKPEEGAKNIDLSLIDEDKDQPRTMFDIDSLKELAESITQRGVRTPISVRQNGDRFTINHGARRYRASEMAGKKTIPAFIDNDYMPVDQLIENIQREDLNPMDIAIFMDKILKTTGAERQAVAQMIGKSPAYVTHHLKLLSLSEPVGKLFKSGRCTDLRAINDIDGLYKKDPDRTLPWIKDPDSDLTRNGILSFKEYLKETHRRSTETNAIHPEEDGKDPDGDGYKNVGKERSDFDQDQDQGDFNDRKKRRSPGRPAKYIHVQFEDVSGTVTGIISLKKDSTRSGLIWIILDNSDGIDIEVEAAKLSVLGVVERIEKGKD